MSKVISVLKSVLFNNSGSLTVPFAISAVPLVVVAGMAADYSHSYSAWTQLQDAADAGALAGAIQNTASPDARISAAANVFQANLQESDFPTTSTPVIGFDGKNVTVSASASVSTYLLSLIGKNTFDIDVTAMAERAEGARVCMLALNTSSTKGIQITGNSSAVEAIGCAVHSNASGDSSIHNVSNTTSTAESFCAHGDVHGDNFSPSPLRGCGQVADPFADMQMPITMGCDHNKYKVTNGTHTLSPGIYCNGLSITGGTVTFESGFYHITGGSFKVAGGGEIIGEGVTFYLRGNGAGLDFAAQITAELSAPETGDYAGFLFIQDPDASPGSTSKITGGADVNMVGTFYFPTQGLKMSGTGSLTADSPYSVFVADNFELKGNGTLTLKIDEEAAGFPAQAHAITEAGARLIN